METPCSGTFHRRRARKVALTATIAYRGGLTTTRQPSVEPEYDALSTAISTVPLRYVITLTVAEVAPAGTVTVDGTEADVGLELFSVTVTPDFPAGAVRLIVSVPEPPPVIKTGLTAILRSSAAAAGGVMVTLDEVLLTPE
jgi:hypothetical protein